MTEREHLRWDACENALREADLEILALFSSLSDDMAHHAASNRLASALGAVEDAVMFVQRARALIGAVDLPNTDCN